MKFRLNEKYNIFIESIIFCRCNAPIYMHIHTYIYIKKRVFLRVCLSVYLLDIFKETYRAMMYANLHKDIQKTVPKDTGDLFFYFIINCDGN